MAPIKIIGVTALSALVSAAFIWMIKTPGRKVDREEFMQRMYMDWLHNGMFDTDDYDYDYDYDCEY